jgi:hypothetical protein
VSTSSFTFCAHSSLRVLRLKSLEARAADDRRVCAVEALLGEKLADFLFNEVDDVLVIHHVYLVEEDDELLNTHLLCKEDVLARLRHHAVSRCDHEDCAVHLGGTRDHVLDVVGVARSVDVRVVAVRRLVLRVVERDRNTARLLFRSVVDVLDLLDAGLVALRRVDVEDVQDAAVSVVLPWST